MGKCFYRFAIAIFVASLIALMPALCLADGILQSPKFAAFKAPPVASAKEDSYVLTSDTLDYDQNLGIITARGNVEIVQEPYILMADTVSYNEKESVVKANGNVRLMQPSGDVVFTDYMELTGDLKNGFTKNVRMLLNDNSRMAAYDGKRIDNNILSLRKVVYSPCNLCAENPRKAPLWQIKAEKATHNQEEKEIEYEDMTLEMAGIPVFYTPYFSHPDPSVKRKSGLLSSSLTTNNDLGVLVRNYYYWALAPDEDFTFEGSYATAQGPLTGAEWRKRFDKGKINLSGTLALSDFDTRADTKNDRVRGHFFADSEYDFNSKWRAGYVGGYASDPSYLRFYRIDSRDIIRNRLYAERFDKRDYLAVNAYAFQDLRPNRPGDQPNVLPDLSASLYGAPGGFLGGRWQADAGALSVVRPGSAQDVQRTNVALNWQRRFVSDTGLVADADIHNEAALYSVQNANNTTMLAGQDQNFFESRAYPEGQLTMRYPMAKSLDDSTLLLEPMLAYTAIPRVKNNRIPNEDSQNFELDVTNLFALNRFPGIDRVDDSNRVTYGMRGAYDQNDGFYSSAFFGQSYNLNSLRNPVQNSGIEDDFSDYVGQVQVTPSPYFDAEYRFRLDEDTFKPRQHELRFIAGPPILNISGNYMLADQISSNSLARDRKQQLSLNLTTKLTPEWSLSLFDTRNIGSDDGGALTSGALIQYLDECFAFQVFGQRDYTQRVGIDSGDTIYFQLTFRNLGSFASPTISPNFLTQTATSSTTSSTTTN